MERCDAQIEKKSSQRDLLLQMFQQEFKAAQQLFTQSQSELDQCEFYHFQSHLRQELFSRKSIIQVDQWGFAQFLILICAYLQYLESS